LIECIAKFVRLVDLVSKVLSYTVLDCNGTVIRG
jgi:hypothetical protein